jgi:hypothetical protein
MIERPREPRSEDEKTAGRPSKRVRVSQACQPCRFKKSKCDGRQPRCNVCERHSIRCSYDPTPKKRGLRPGQHSSLERRAWLAELLVVFLTSATPEAEGNLGSFFSFHDPGLPFLVPGRKQAQLQKHLDQWRRGPVAKWLLETSARNDPAVDQLSTLMSSQNTEARLSGTTDSDDQNVPSLCDGTYSLRTASIKTQTGRNSADYTVCW